VLEISLLGEQRVAVDGSILITLRSPRTMALLAYLLLHRDAPQRRDYVAGQFWPDSTAAQARTNLRRELHALRAALPDIDRWLASDGGTLLWRHGNDCHLDVAIFETAAQRASAAAAARDQAAFRLAAAEAVDAYRGELMPALYDDWIAGERERLHRRCLTLVDQLIDLERSAGAHANAIDLARRRIDLEPLEEVGYRALLQAQAMAGDRAAALQTYYRCVSVLERELGVEPDAATTAEYQRLAGGATPGRAAPDLARDPAAAWTPRGSTAPAPPGPAGPLAPMAPASSSVPLLGRERELDALRKRWQESLGGAAGLAVVAGEAGVGKSRLLDELASFVEHSGGIAVRAHCFAARSRLALAPVSEWLRSPPLRAAHGRLEPVWAREVDRLVPPPDPPSSTAPAAPLRPMADAWQRHRFFEGLARAVLSAGRPTLMVLDDLQWCDEDTLAWLQLLLRLGEGHQLLVVAATRLEEVADNPELTATLRALRSVGQVTDVYLAPLDPERSAELAACISGSPLTAADAEWLFTTTGGYPLFVIECARAGVLSNPGELPGARAVLEGRIEQAGPAAREIAGLAAAIGHDFTLELLCEASDLDSEIVIEAVDELWRRRIIREHSPTSYDFSHDLLRDTAYATLSPPRRRMLHQHVAQALEQVHAGDQDFAAAELADQYERAGQAPLAVPHHVRAAEIATGVFANTDAIRHYRRAIELLRHAPPGRERDRTELAIRHAMAAPLNAQYGYASAELYAVVGRASDLARRLGDTRLELLSLVGLFAVRYVQGHIADSYKIANRSLKLSHLHADVIGQAHFAVAGSATSLALHEKSLQHFALAHELCQDAPPALVGTRLEVHARAWCAHALWLLGRDEEALKWCDWAIARADEVDHPYSLAVALSYAAITHQLRRDKERTMEFATRVQEICTRYDFAYYGSWGIILAGWCVGGDDGARQIREGLRNLRDQGALARQPYYMGLLAETLILSGHGHAAGAVLDAARAAAAAHDDRWWLPELWRLDARCRRGQSTEALLRRAATLAEKQGSLALLRRAAADLADGI
jgi:DNA-binding SARP family transcriptional activator/tetratricopeptide (TPR) repeat protein